MRIRFSFSLKTTLICLILIVGMIRASIWQWDRHQQKEQLVEELRARIELPVVPLTDLLQKDIPVEEIQYRRVTLQGTYDFDNEMILRNRKHQEEGPGVHVLTPLEIKEIKERVIIDRGFLPFSEKNREKRKKYQKKSSADLVGLIKPAKKRRALQPKDKGSKENRIDAWLRVDLERMESQLPYKLAPFYIEIMSDVDPKAAVNNVVSTSSGREDIFFITKEARKVSTGEVRDDLSYPIPAHSTLIPSATHLAYVFEWAIMALMTALIGLILQLKRH